WEKGIGIVVNFEGEDPTESLRRIAHSIFDQLQKQLPFSFVLSVGSADDSALNMGISFYRATATIKAQTMPNDSGVCFWRETTLEMTAAPDTTLLAEAVTFGNSEVALKAFHDLCQRLGRVNEPYSIIHMMCCDLLNTIIRAAQRQNVTPDPAELKNAAEFSSLQDFEARSEEMIRSICQHASQRREEDASREHSELISFITRNYKHNDFSLSMLAEEMEMSISKINMLLKEKIGCSFVQYVSLLRINEVKRMLRETDLPIQAIVQEVGYLDMSSFIRKFRRMEGISPGQYRAQYRE
ncbi:MAG: helix-turn-helix transcriptional regulator, partial [Clostridia bacterium]|nr:helix-turn-helix transcriptional regulator [Clostridia bacterium]